MLGEKDQVCIDKSSYIPKYDHLCVTPKDDTAPSNDHQHSPLMINVITMINMNDKHCQHWAEREQESPRVDKSLNSLRAHASMGVHDG